MMNARPANYGEISNSTHGSFYRSGLHGLGMGDTTSIDLSNMPILNLPLTTPQEIQTMQPIVNDITNQGLLAPLQTMPPGGLLDPTFILNFLSANIIPIGIVGGIILFVSSSRKGRR